MRERLGSLVIAVFSIPVLPALVQACPVCFSATDSPVVNGVGMAILALLGVTAAVLACFAAFFVNLMRRSRHAGAMVQAPPLARPVEHGGHS